MRERIIGCLIAAGLLLTVAVSVSASEANFRLKLGCVPFLAANLQAMAFTENISASLLNSFDRSSLFEVVERRKMEQILELEDLRLDNLNQESIARIGVKAGLDYVVHGNVGITESGAVIDVNLFNVRSNKQIMKASHQVSESDFSRKVQEIATTIVDRIRNAGAMPAETPASTPLLTAQTPKGVTASGSSSSIRLSWSHDDLKLVAGFNIYRSSAPEGPFSHYATTTAPRYVDENLKLNEIFYYRIATVNQDGSTSGQCAAVKGETTIAPSPPIFMNVEADIKGARLTWRPRPNTGGDSRITPQGYKIYRRPAEDGAMTRVADLSADSATLSDSGLSEGIKYIYVITSYNRDGAESDYSASLSVIPLPPPAPPRAKSGMPRRIALSWNRYTGGSAEGYMIYRADKKDGAYTRIATLEGVNVTEYIDLELTANTTYWYRLSVYNKGGGETTHSVPVSAVTEDLLPHPVQPP